MTLTQNAGAAPNEICLGYSVSPKGASLLQRHCFPLGNELIPIPGLGRQLNNFSLDVLMNKYYIRFYSSGR